MIKFKIKQVAKKKGIATPTQLAKLMDLSPTVIWRYWEGKQIPGVEIALKISEALDCELSDLIVRNGKKRRR